MTYSVRTIFLLLCVAIFGGCGDNESACDAKYNPVISQLQNDKRELQKKITSLELKIDEVKDKARSLAEERGYFVISTWVGLLTSIVLFCTGLAFGMKIKREHMQHDATQKL